MQIVRVWINEIDSVKSTADLKTSHSVTEAKLTLKKRVTSKEESIQEDAAQKEKRFLTRSQVAWMIHEYLKVGDTHESVLDLHEILRVELKNDNVQSLNARWEETLSR